MPTKRRDFLGILGGAGLLATAPITFPAASGNGGDPYAKSEKFDFSWMKRVKGKGRAVFDMPTPTNGYIGWDRLTTWHQQAIEVYGDPKHVTSIAVIRHMAIPFVMNDAYWEQFKVAEGLKMDAKYATRNPLSRAHEPAPANPREGAGKYDSIEGFQESGGIVLACNLAFGMVRGRVGRANSLTGDAADKKAKEMLLPGVILMPSGIFAMIVAQQTGCGAMSGI
jgi:hypothetical protein